MVHQSNSTSVWRPQCWILAGALLLVFSTARAADNIAEREQLATLVRQLDMLDRLAEQSVTLSQKDQSRYHFDYAQLREDIEHIRRGIQDYLTPQRAQPRDTVELSGDYCQESEDAP